MTAFTRPAHSPSVALAIALAMAIVLGYAIAPVRDAWAEPRWLRITWTVPDATDTTMTVAWNDTDPGGGTVAWRLLGDLTEGTMSAPAFDTGSGLLDYTYEATVTGLTASSFYEYRVFSGGVWSAWRVFRTAPALGSCDPVRLVAGGDGRGGEAFWDPGYVSHHWDNIASTILADVPVVMLYSGDLVHDGTEEQWEEWFRMSEILTRNVPVMPVLGNHDTGPGDGDGAYYNKLFVLPKGGAGALDSTVDPDGDGIEDMWAVVVGNVLLIGLNTEGIDVNVQHQFLNETLAYWRPRVDWVFLQFHRPLWSSGIGHGSNEDDKLDAATLITYIDDYPVDFVIAGHDHDYERFDPMWGGYGGRPHVINPLPLAGASAGVPDGVIHIVTGGAGSFTNLAMFCSEAGCRVASGNLHYMVFDVEPLQATAVVRDMGPILTLADAYLRPDPLDSFTVMHTSSVCDIVPPDEEPEVVEPPPDTAPDATVDTATDTAGDPPADLPPDLPADLPPDFTADTAGDPAEDDPGQDDPGNTSGCGCSLVR